MNKIVIDWSHIPTYTTIMGVFAGNSLISVANLGRKLLKTELNLTGWALNFFASGIVLLITGTGMVLTWPLAIPFDNIVFGETSLGLAILDLALAYYLWKKRTVFEQSNVAQVNTISKELSPFRTVLTGLGFGIIGIAISAYQHKFFIAPPPEPIAGNVALKYPIAENVFISSMFLFVGIAALLTILFLSDFSKDKSEVKWYHKANYVLLQMTGWYFLLSGALVFYTHIGLISNTMK